MAIEEEVNNNSVIDSYESPKLNISATNRKYYTMKEVHLHSTPSDCWVVIYNQVLNISDLIPRMEHPRSVILSAGTDISWWFSILDIETDEVFDNIANCIEGKNTYTIVPKRFPPDFDEYSPMGKYSHEDNWYNIFISRFVIGKLSIKTAFIILRNTMLRDDDPGALVELTVPIEETLREIRNRYLVYNIHACSYTIKDKNGHKLQLDKTLSDNGINVDEVREMLDLGVNGYEFAPILLLYWNDDLSEM